MKSKPQTYSLTQLMGLRLIPWARNDRTLRKLILADRKASNLLDSTVTGKGSQVRYTVTAAGLKNYLATYGPAFASKVRKPKRHAK